MLMKTQPESKRVAFVYENDKFSTSVVEAARAYAKEKGLEEVLYEGYQSGTTDFGPFINKIQGASPDAILGGGHFQDGSTLAVSSTRKAPRSTTSPCSWHPRSRRSPNSVTRRSG